jgi:SAM-dependent MidA family methyltransferase
MGSQFNGKVARLQEMNPILPSEGERIATREFMRRALYDPRYGYYARNVSAVGGADGDFATSASLDPGFAAAIARWIESEIAERPEALLGDGDCWHLVELGGGGGHLAAGVLRELNWKERQGCLYHLVEISPVLQSMQRRTLGKRATEVTWHVTLNAALQAANGRAIVFSNEFVDAFPTTVIEWDTEHSSWFEVFLENRGGRKFAEVLLRFRGETAAFSAMDRSRWGNVPLVDGQRCELLASWREWLLDWISNVHAVSMLTIDYGDTFPMLYRGQRDGTLRAYRNHRRITGTNIYANAGQQDLTVDVNFTDLLHWCEEAGLTTVSFDSQREFLERFAYRSNGAESSLVSEFLRDPAGAGEAFRVLSQRK